MTRAFIAMVGDKTRDGARFDLQLAARSSPAKSPAGAAHKISITMSFAHSSHSTVRRTIAQQARGKAMMVRRDAATKPSEKEFRSMCDACVTSVGFIGSANPSIRDPWIQKVCIATIMKQHAAEKRWNLTTELNIRSVASARAQVVWRAYAPEVASAPSALGTSRTGRQTPPRKQPCTPQWRKQVRTQGMPSGKQQV
eukprot:6172443-Pleurochrysis_carterae.AAC.2